MKVRATDLRVVASSFYASSAESVGETSLGVTSLSNVALVDEVRFFVVTEEAP